MNRQLQNVVATPGNGPAPGPVWVLHGSRAGDSAQVLTLARALGWPFEDKTLYFKPSAEWPNLILGARRASLDKSRSTALIPPWPELVIGIGRRSVPIMRWIKMQSGDRAKLVHLGRPSAPRKYFDLIITTPQFRLPDLPNVLQLPIPIHHLDEKILREGRRQWSDQIEKLPRPRIAVLAGGDGKPYRFDQATARDLGRRASEFAGKSGGSLLVTSSNRSRPEAVDALFDAISVPALTYRWKANDPDNRYISFVANADAIIVTADSVSMLAEAVATSRPVYIYDLPQHHGVKTRIKYRLYDSPRFNGLMERLIDAGVRVPRDFDRVHRYLIDHGMAARLGDPPPAGGSIEDDPLQMAVSRIRDLMSAPTG